MRGSVGSVARADGERNSQRGGDDDTQRRESLVERCCDMNHFVYNPFKITDVLPAAAVVPGAAGEAVRCEG